MHLKVISFVYVTKMRNIDALENSNVQYITFDSSDNYGLKQPILFDRSVLSRLSGLKHLSLVYKDCNIDY